MESCSAQLPVENFVQRRAQTSYPYGREVCDARANRSDAKTVMDGKNRGKGQAQLIISEYNQTSDLQAQSQNFHSPYYQVFNQQQCGTKSHHSDSIFYPSATMVSPYVMSAQSHGDSQNLPPPGSSLQVVNPMSLTLAPIGSQGRKRRGIEDVEAVIEEPSKKRKPVAVPENEKDESYWERRRKNNESAKRSRQIRRAKERQTTWKISQLEAKNLELTLQLSLMQRQLQSLQHAFNVLSKNSCSQI